MNDLIFYEHLEHILSARQPISKSKKVVPFSETDSKRQAVRNVKSGEVIFDHFVDSTGKAICHEAAIRAKTVDIYKAQLRSELNYLLELQDSDLGVAKRIKKIQEKIDISNHLTSEWASTNSPRLLFEKAGIQGAKALSQPILANLRLHKVELEDEGFATNRSAAISDFAHANTNLHEIKDYHFLCSFKFGDQVPGDKVDHFLTYYKTDIRNQQNYLNLMKELRENIKRAYGSEKIAHLDEIENERRDCLRTQILQDLFVHFSHKPVDDLHAFYCRIAFLDPTKKPEKDKTTGYYVNEKNQLLDMKAIYDELDGVKVIFDLGVADGPFFDRQGCIHMPRSCSSPAMENREVTLNTVLFNASVQNNQKNTGLQLAVNRRAFYKLHHLPLTHSQRTQCDFTMDKLLSGANTSFTKSRLLIQFARELGYCSVDCYGGKDRTGYALALETYYAIRKKMKENAQHNVLLKKDYNKTMEAIRIKLLAPTGVAVRVVQDNTGVNVLKISSFMLKLYVSGRGMRFLRGVKRRLSDYTKAAALFLPKEITKQPEHHDASILYDRDLEITALKKLVLG